MKSAFLLILVSFLSIQPSFSTEHVVNKNKVEFDEELSARFVENCELGENIEEIKEALKSPALDVNYSGFFIGETPLMGAISYGHVDIAKLILTHPDVNVNIIGGLFKQSALEMAIEQDYSELVSALIKHPKIDVNLDIGFQSYLIRAIDKGNIQYVKQLVEHPQININATTDRGNTALMYAALKAPSYGEYEIGLLLLNHPKIDVNQKNDEGETAFNFTSIYSDFRETLKKYGSHGYF